MNWSIEQSKELYGIDRWSNRYFDINNDGEVVVNLKDGEKNVPVSLEKMIQGLKERGQALPQLLRFRDLVDDRIQSLNETFRSAITDIGYQGEYRGVYPIKVNQQQQVIEEITEFGEQYNYGLEAGSKPELIAALAYMHNPQAYIICNGYKDDEFIDLALLSSQMGLQIILVIEMPSEVDHILKRASALGIEPKLGIRFRLSTRSAGHWADSGGDRSVFGLNSTQVLEVVDKLRLHNQLHCLKLLHYHQGSQIPNIQEIRNAAIEAAHIYVNLVQEGAPMGILDLGGGLAVDYDGSHTDDTSSCNYSLQEYCTNILELVKSHCDQANIPHPNIVSESGRYVVAYYSVLVFNILATSEYQNPESPDKPKENAHEMIKNLWAVKTQIHPGRLVESFNDVQFYRDQIRTSFLHGMINLRERAYGEKLYWHLCTRIAEEASKLENPHEELEVLMNNLVSYYYGNFSVFQSLPDSWAIDQLFPIMPLHRLDEEPSQSAILSDITCDCDGKIDRFIDSKETQNSLALHPIQPDESYHIGTFLVGAYQETLGDLHNLLGDTNVVSVDLVDGELQYTHEVEGDSVADVLSYVEYSPKDLEKRFRKFAEKAVTKNLITPKMRKQLMETYRTGLSGYTYFEETY